MTATELSPYEFIISLDNDAVAIFQEGKSVNVQIKNPHKAGTYDVATLSLLKVLVQKLKDLKPRKKLPSDSEIAKAIHPLKRKAMEGNIDLATEIYKKAWADSQ